MHYLMRKSQVEQLHQHLGAVMKGPGPLHLFPLTMLTCQLCPQTGSLRGPADTGSLPQEEVGQFFLMSLCKTRHHF